MGFIKVVKNKAYFSRYQVKWRRRREGKTDYYARKRLILQDKNKYNSPKYRLVVRFTNRDVVCQVAYAKLQGDVILASAYAHELTQYGFPVVEKNYAAAYATGLLLARRVLSKLGLAEKYVGNTGAVGEDYNVELLGEDEPCPFKALLDVGLRRTTTGAKVFAALKGAVDGGIDVPHSDRRFVGFDKEGNKLDAEVLRKHIYGGHIAEYMKLLKAENPGKFDKVFSRYVKAGITADNLEATWTKTHANIRANPAAKKSDKKKPETQKRFAPARRSLSQRKDRVRQKLASKARQAAEAGAQ